MRGASHPVQKASRQHKAKSAELLLPPYPEVSPAISAANFAPFLAALALSTRASSSRSSAPAGAACTGPGPAPPGATAGAGEPAGVARAGRAAFAGASLA